MPNKLVLEKEFPLELEGVPIGSVKAKVFEGLSPHIKQGDMNDTYLIARGVYNDKVYEIQRVRGGIDLILNELKNHILKELKK